MENHMCSFKSEKTDEFDPSFYQMNPAIVVSQQYLKDNLKDVKYALGLHDSIEIPQYFVHLANNQSHVTKNNGLNKNRRGIVCQSQKDLLAKSKVDEQVNK